MEPEISEGEIKLCAGVNIDGYIAEAKEIATSLYELFKKKKDMNITSSFTFENAASINGNYGSYEKNFKYAARYIFHILTSSVIGSGDFVIEVNINLDRISCYKFNMRWKEQKEE